MNFQFELEDILDKIIPEEDEPDYINDPEDFLETLLHLMENYIKDNPRELSDPDFEDIFQENIIELVNVQLEDHRIFYNEEEIEVFLEEAFDLFYDTIMPRRSFPDSEIIEQPNIYFIEKQINYLRSLPQPTQRTAEWYKFRHNLITASNAYKAYENNSIRNNLIYEKCQPLVISESTVNNFVNVNTTLHWGQKYEPVSILIYEYMYKTTIEDFGCIQHPTYSFLGASPDGINVDSTNPRYGRMLEIKNIVNREIDGIPKKEYWIQMQLQMETCDLDECDFLETKFVEYDTEEEFKKDDESEYKGIILYFSTESKPIYKYCPIRLHENEEAYAKWEEETMDSNSDKTWIKTIYWKAETVSCVLVQRNKMWFELNIDELKNVWSIIEKERVEGFEHRSPNKRTKKEDHAPFSGSGCLINVNKLLGKTDIIPSSPAKNTLFLGNSLPIQVVKIRTESFDDTKKQFNDVL
jgi:hypothetical protein